MGDERESICPDFLPEANVIGSDQGMGRGGSLREKPFSYDTIIDKSHEIDEL